MAFEMIDFTKDPKDVDLLDLLDRICMGVSLALFEIAHIKLETQNLSDEFKNDLKIAISTSKESLDAIERRVFTRKFLKMIFPNGDQSKPADGETSDLSTDEVDENPEKYADYQGTPAVSGVDVLVDADDTERAHSPMSDDLKELEERVARLEGAMTAVVAFVDATIPLLSKLILGEKIEVDGAERLRLQVFANMINEGNGNGTAD